MGSSVSSLSENHEGGAVTVYVDTMRAKYRRMIMCHMVADTEEELHAMADKIGVSRKWYQGNHYDICLAKKKLALKYGACEITMRELAYWLRVRRKAAMT